MPSRGQKLTDLWLQSISRKTDTIAERIAQRRDQTPRIIDPDAARSAVELLEIDGSEESAVSTLELLKRIGGCSPAVRIKADLDSEAKFKSLERGLNKFLKLGLLETRTLQGSFDSYSNLQVWMLSDEGKRRVRSTLP